MPEVSSDGMLSTFTATAADENKGMPSNKDSSSYRIDYETRKREAQAARQLILAEKARRDAETEVKQLQAKIERLEKSHRYLFEKEKEATSELEKIEDERMKLKEESTMTIQQLYDKNNVLSEQLADVRSQLHDAQQIRQKEQTDMLATIDKLTREYQSCSEQLLREQETSACQRSALNDARNWLTDLEEELQKARAANVEKENLEVMTGELHRQVKYVSSLERSNGHLKEQLRRMGESLSNVELLKEEKSELAAKLKGMDELRARLATLEVDNAVLRKEKAQWTAFLSEDDSNEFDTPYAMTRAIAALRTELVGLKEKEGLMKAEMASRDTYINNAEQYIEELKREFRELSAKYKDETLRSQLLEKTRALAQKEIAFLREQLNSYDLEEATFMPESYDEQKTKRLSQLQTLLDEHKERIHELESEMQQSSTHKTREKNDGQGTDGASHDSMLSELPGNQALQTHMADLLKDRETLMKDLEAEKGENTLLRKEIDSLSQQVTILQDALGRGEFNENSTRVLSFKANPASMEQAIRESTLEALRQENEALLEEVKALQGIIGPENQTKRRKGDDISFVPVESVNALQLEKTQLQATLAQKEKMNLRLKEAFAAKINEYKEAIYSILGYKLDFLENGRVRLSNMYRQSDDHSFVFRSEENNQGTMQLVGSGNKAYMKSVESAIRYWVVERGSIPAFMSTITLELFDQMAISQEAQRPDSPNHRRQSNLHQ